MPFAVFAVILGAIGWANVFAAPPLPLEELNTCGRACWHDIVLRQTDFRQADAMMLDEGYEIWRGISGAFTRMYELDGVERNCVVGLVSSRGQAVTSIRLSQCEGVRLGDLIAAVGQPEGVMPSTQAVTFQNGEVVASIREDTCFYWISPFSSVQTIYLESLGGDEDILQGGVPYPPELALPWRGFRSRAYYLQFEPTMRPCRF